MNSILNNPYRILGLLANASAREINTRVNRLRMYIEAEEEMPENDDFGFPKAMGKPERSKASVDKARSGLNMDEDRVSNALFWFWKDNDISDEAAFDALKDQDEDTAIGIWQKLTDKGEVTERNCSAFLNLSTLLLYLSMNGKTVKKKYFKKGLQLKIQFLESRFSDEFVKKVGDETCKKDTIKLELWLLNQIPDNLGKVKGLTPIEMTEMLSGWTFAAKDKFLKEFSSALAKDINDKVKICSGKRNKTPEKANELGDELYKSVGEDLLQLKKILGESNMTYGDTADAVAEEVLQCAIDCFMYSLDSRSKNLEMFFNIPEFLKTCSASIDLIHQSLSFVVGNRVKHRCNENLKTIQEYYDNWNPEKRKEKEHQQREEERRQQEIEERRRQENERRRQENERRRQEEEKRRRREEQERIRKQRITVFGIQFRGNAFWVGVKWIFWVSLIFFGIFALLEYQWHALSAPTSKYMRGLPYSCVLVWSIYISYGITSLIGRNYKASGIFLRFLANVAILLFYLYFYPIIQEKNVLPMFDKISFVIIALSILIYAFFQIAIALKNSPRYNMNSTIFRQNGPPGLMYLIHFFKSLIIPFIILAVVFLADLTINPFWQDVLWIYGFLLVWNNIRMMLVCNIQYRNRSKIWQYLHAEHLMLFLPEAGVFLIWHFNWWPTPQWVTGVYAVYGFFWLLTTISLLITKEKK